eukprot:2203112-Pleurochrysis_carterae.AAC.1
MNGAEAGLIHKARELLREGPVKFVEHMIDYGVVAEQQTWSSTWRKFLEYAQRGDRGKSARENARIDEQKKETRTREAHPTLYAGEVVGENEARTELGRQRRNMRGLTDRAEANQHKQELKEETRRNKRMRL